MAVNVVVSIGAKIGEYLMVPVGRHFGYLYTYKSNLENLRNEVNKLEERRGAVLLSVNAAERNGEVIGPDVKGWLARVDEHNGEASKILEDEVEANKRCLNGWCPNLKLRYSLGRKATKKAEEITKLHGVGNFTAVSYTAPPPGIESISTSTEGSKGFKSRRLIRKYVVEALKDDRFNMIGICGMGGVGKTTMVKEVAKRAKEEKLFDDVVMAVVSKSPDERNIQGEIADKLGLNFVQETVSGRADRLRERLRSIKRILVILDDVWKRLELNDIGIPIGDGHWGCKILLTSRFDYVCNDMGAQMKFTVPTLAIKESWNLFKEMAGISDHTSHTSTDLYFTQKAVATECGGLPIAIVTVARALRYKDMPSWDSALQQLRRSVGKNIRGVDADVFKLLEWSYNFIESKEVKKCFLLCSLYPEDFDIPIEDLIRYGIGIELFEAIDSVGEARDRVHDFVDDLKKCYLLMDSERKECVKMHDVVRDVAISIASREEHSFMVRCDKAFKEWPEKEQNKTYSVISLRCTGTSGFPDNLEFPKLQLLRLECKDIKLSHMHPEGSKLSKTPSSFYGGMKELKVMALSYMHIGGSLSTSLRWLTNLRTLSLYNCKEIDDISVIGVLENLEILSFAGTRIKELPKEIGSLTHLKVLDLLNCGVIWIHPGVLSSLSKLEELYVGNLFDNWGGYLEETKAIITELGLLSNFMTLVITLRCSEFWPRELVLANLKAFSITIGSWMPRTNDLDGYQLQNLLIISELHGSDLMKSRFKILMKITKVLLLEVEGLKNVIYDLDKDGFKHLTKLRLHRCQDLEYLIETADEVPQRAFPVLQSLCLDYLCNLKEICHGQLPEEAFSALKELRLIFLTALTHLWKGPTQFVRLRNLRYVEVTKCDKLESVFSFSIARDLKQLQTLDIAGCYMMEEIISSEEGDQHEITSTETIDKIEFPKLNRLNLGDLSSFTAFCKAMNAIELPQLNRLELHKIPKLNSLCTASDSNYDTIQPLFHNKNKLTSIVKLSISAMDNLIEIWPCELHKLREMRVYMCHRLPKIFFPSNLIKGMQSLKLLDVEGCRSVKVAFDLEGLIVREGHSDILLPSLTKVNLSHLPKLTHVWKDNLPGIQGFQNLTSLRIMCCGSLRYILSSSLAKLLVKLQEIEVTECVAMEAIVDKEPKVDDEVDTNMIMFPQLNSLKLSDLPNLRSLCPQAYTFEGSLLKTGKVINCPNMKALPSSFQRIQELQRSNAQKADFISAQHHLLDRKFSFSSMGELTVIGIDDPTEIWYNQLEDRCLHEVRFLQVLFCGKLLSVVASNLMQRLHNIIKLKVWWCDSLEMIFDLQGGVCDGAGEEETSITQLSNLELKYLPKLMYIWKSFPQQNHCFENLRSVKVERCDNLRYIFTISMANVLVNLKYLTIQYCEKVEKIVTRENKEEILSRRFDSVELTDLPSLLCFGPDVNDTRISTREITVEFCPKFAVCISDDDDDDGDGDE